jgi:transcriptional regulator with GAF, ATPase, and Fis domain
MKTAAPAEVLFTDPKRLLLDMGEQRSLAALLTLVVERLAASEGVALVRIWLMRPGDICASCPLRVECPDQEVCLHLVASAGRSVAEPGRSWSSTGGRFRRFPLGVRKVGLIARSGEALQVPDIEQSNWIVDRDWVCREGIAGFCGQPLVYQQKVLGVLAVFTRARLGPGGMDWLRMIANHAAVAIATAQAFEEITALKRRLEEECEYLREEVREASSFGELIGSSPALAAVGRQIDLVAPTDASVLILGETGTGKELVAREIHRRSARAEKALIKVNCAAVPRELYESEFFGHVKGAFTGALRDRAGRFELADGGTLFLDEVGEVPLELQGKLLRVLQEGELERVGEERARRVDVRIVAATNRDLRKDAEAGRFRRDLYFRLNVFPIEIVPLRQRPEDIPLLAEHFLRQAALRYGRPAPSLRRADVQQLRRYDWPGNVRELRHILDRAVITGGNRLHLDLPVTDQALRGEGVAPATPEPDRILTAGEMTALERANIERALRATKGKIYGEDGAAKLLGLKPTTLASRIKALGISRALMPEAAPGGGGDGDGHPRN